jgi:hypothetical protein
VSDEDQGHLGREIGRLRQERDRLQEEVSGLRGTVGGLRRTRAMAVTAMVVVAVLAFGATVPGTWTRRTLLDTDRYVVLAAEIARQPAVRERLAARITDAALEALDVSGRLQRVLGDIRSELAFLAGPISQAVHDLVRERVEELLATDRFAELWTEANRVAHTRILAVLRGDSETVSIVDGRVAVNALPLVNEALRGLSSFAAELAGRPVTLPEITAEMVPGEAIARLEEALGVDLPDDLGAIAIYEADEFAAVQQALYRFDRGVVALAVLWLLASAGALVVSTRTRRTLLQLAIAVAVVLVLERRFAIVAVDGVVDGLEAAARPAGRAAAEVLLGGFLGYTAWLLAVVLAVLVVGLLTGPYEWAARTRTASADLVSAAVGAIRGTQAGPAARWVAPRRDPLLLAGAVVFIVVLLVVDVGLTGFLLLAAALALYVVVIWRTAAAVAPGPP